jgi:hypothetical protein
VKKENVRLALVFKDFAAWTRSSCVGLNIAGYTTANVLRQAGFNVIVFPVRDNVDVVTAIDHYNETNPEPLTHVVISAPWLSAYDLKALITNFKGIEFVVLSHSNVGFLQADPNGVELLRAYLTISQYYPNLKVGGNSKRFVEWLRGAYGEGGILLPNLYPLDGAHPAKVWDGTAPLKIGAFGAVRPEKNFMTAAAAALLIQRFFNIPVEFHMSAGGEGDQGRTADAINQMAEGLPDFKVIRHDWIFWDGFIGILQEMDLLIQVSYTESFNMVTADGIFVGVPSVVSPVISWAPREWKADPDDASNVAEVGINLLSNASLVALGYDALAEHDEHGLERWENFLLRPKSSWTRFWDYVRKLLGA